MKEKIKFVEPELEEVIEFAISFFNQSTTPLNIPDLEMECEMFYDYYSNTDWTICQGKRKMKDWKLALRNWLRNASNRNQRFNRPRYGQYNGFMTKQEYISDSNRRLHEEWLKQRQQEKQQSNQQEETNNVLSYDWLFTGNK